LAAASDFLAIVKLPVQLSRTTRAALFGAVLAAGAGFSLHEFNVGLGLVYRSYDLLQVARGEVAATEAVLVYLDDRSHEELRQPRNAPWDRALHARLIERLTAAGARAIVFDVVFSDPLPNQPAADAAFLRAVKTSGRVILGADNVPIGPGAMKMVPPFPELLDSAAGVGSVEVRASHDLIVREHTPEEQLPSLSWAAAEFAGVPVTKQDAERGRPRWMTYYGPPNFLPWVRYSAALDPAQASDEFFRDKVVFVGARLFTKFAGERKDEYRNPFSLWLPKQWVEERGALFMAGVEVQATAYLNLLRGDWLTRAPLGLERVVIVALGLAVGFGLVRLRPWLAAAAAFAGLAAVALVAYWLFAVNRVWWPWLIVAVQIGLALLWSILFNSFELYAQKRVYEQTLRLYLPPKLVKKFSGNPNLLKPGAEEQTLTILFSDIADFTTISQAITTEALARMMNQYFQSAVANCIHRTEGTVVKYIGDAIFAFWNAPELQPDHALRAGEAALRFRELGRQSFDGQSLRTRIGIHTGTARVGNFGSLDRVDYTALGESVNLASRLEGLNKYLGTECLITGATRALIGEQLLTRRVGMFQMKGFDKPVEVHELLGWPDQAEATRAWRDAFAQALKLYEERNLEFADMAFRRVLPLKPDDGPTQFYLQRIAELASQELPGEWVTHTILKEK
jgi:adenylate cyclase